MSDDRAKILAKIKAMLETKGCTESEAMSRLDKAAELMARYEISRADVEGAARDDRYGFRRRPFCNAGRSGRARLPEVAGLVPSIAKLCDCEVMLSANPQRVSLDYFGTALDTELAHFMTDMLRNVMESQWKRFYESIDAAAERSLGVHGRVQRSNFMSAFIRRVKARIIDITEAKNATVSASERGRALVVCKQEIVTQRYEEQKPENTRTRTTRIGSSGTSASAQAAGDAAGQRVELGARGIGATGAPRQIGG
jgi:hypothetical protein